MFRLWCSWEGNFVWRGSRISLSNALWRCKTGLGAEDECGDDKVAQISRATVHDYFHPITETNPDAKPSKKHSLLPTMLSTKKVGQQKSSAITWAWAKKCLKCHLATTHRVHYKQYTVVGSGCTAGNEVAASTAEKTLHEYLTWYDANWQSNGVMLHKA